MDKFIIRDKNTKEIIKDRVNYPSIDKDKEIKGFDYDKCEIFIIKEESKPIVDENKEILEKVESYTTKKSKDYYNTRILEITWKINQLPAQTIINKLNKSLGDHLDSQYPIWERVKHAGEGAYILWNKSESDLTQEELDRKVFIDSTYEWIKGCREERDRREVEFLTNNTFPSFEWENRP